MNELLEALRSIMKYCDPDKPVQSEIFYIAMYAIKGYEQNIANKKKRLADLLEKGEREGLSSIEKNDLLDIQDELNNLDKTQKREVPKHLLTDESIETLSKTRKEAEKFLQSLTEKKGKLEDELRKSRMY